MRSTHWAGVVITVALAVGIAFGSASCGSDSAGSPPGADGSSSTQDASTQDSGSLDAATSDAGADAGRRQDAGASDAGSGSPDAAGPGHDAGVDGGSTSSDAGAATDAGSSSDGGCHVWVPAPRTTWQWQLNGTIDTGVDVAMYDIDLFEAPQVTVDALHSQGRKVICYLSAGTYEDFRPDATQFPAAALGNPNGWPGEKWLDIRDATVRRIMQARLDRAVTKKCDGVEPDNVDGYANSTGFPLTAADQLDFNRFIAAEAHRRCLSVGLKNDVDQLADLVGDFEWALNEECLVYGECGGYQSFLGAGKAVFHTEYTTKGDTSKTGAVCHSTSRPAGFSTLIKDLGLDAWRIACP
jgi:endo-alpha-1,4-polygalactosaminidase (GH114 family)